MHRNMRRRCLEGLFFLFLLVPLAFPGNRPAQALDLKDAELSELVKKAYIYSFPVYEMYRIRSTIGREPNRFHHVRRLPDHTYRLVTGPNNDTLYSSAWLDLSREPLVLSVPDTAGRYYSMAFMDFYTNNFAYVGRRTTGTKAGSYVVTGPGWSGATPEGLAVIKSPTNAVWLLGRTLVEGETDLPEVHKIQDQYQLTALSVWSKTGQAGAKTEPNKPAPMPPDPKDPLDFFRIVNLGLTENPPPADEAPLMAELAGIGVGPGQTFDADRLSQEQRKVVLGALEEAEKEIRTARSKQDRQRGGWIYPEPNLGNFGKDYLYRATVALVGLAALGPAEAAYFSGIADDRGKPLSGENRYRLRFPDGALPPVDAFWSMTMYELTPEQRSFLVENPINRYAIGDRTKGLKIDGDGSLTLYIQNQSPGKELEANWLPAPKGAFRLSLRAYQPGESILKGEYTPPAIERVQ